MQEKRLSIKHVELEDNEEEKHIKNRNKNSSKENRMKRNRKSIEILGIEEDADDALEYRVKWGQRGVTLFCFCAVLCFIIGSGGSATTTPIFVLRVASIVFFVITMCFSALMYYKNISFAMIRRLLQELNVVVIVILTISNFIIEITRPFDGVSPFMGFVYMLFVNTFVFVDALKLKSRFFVLVVGSFFLVINLYNIHGLTIKNWQNGIVLFQYTIDGQKHSIMKRSVQRSMFIQITLFCMNGLFVMFKDKRMELMIFATGNIYRKTGTGFIKDVVKDESFVKRKTNDNNKKKEFEVGFSIERSISYKNKKNRGAKI